ncbi:Major exported protein [Vibrio aerogenes CECT 7868]|uniref:Major exported protein n=1 Tax=Vibrio aerogenes CECT 7868 TaxID=1216006 RepID=A0A1M6EW60_9VIBR|nr:Major exported protein [Vibrio aerogenes CECT 7868]
MAHTSYLTLTGGKQGLISSGCNTKDSMGNRYQETHTDHITILACDYSMSKQPNQPEIEHGGIQITKPKDKASPLLATAFAKQEHLEGIIDFYRTNESGHHQKFYSIKFQKAVITSISDTMPHTVHSSDEAMHEVITFQCKGVQWEHVPCGTLAYDGWSDANSIAAILAETALPLTSAERYAKQIHEDMQAEKAAKRQAEKEKQSEQQRRKSDAKEEDWEPISGSYPILVYETQHQMDDFNAPDMSYGDESRETIEGYGFMKPFKQSQYTSYKEGYTMCGEDQFALSAEEHFKRLRDLGEGIGFSMIGKTKDVFSEMVDKLERNEGGYYQNSLLTNALKEHKTTKEFHAALLLCLENNVSNGVLDNDILNISSNYMKSEKTGAKLPRLTGVFDGTVLTVHGIWSMQIYATKLEYKGNNIRGDFLYKIQDHFGLNSADINHPSFLSKNKPGTDGQSFISELIHFLGRVKDGSTNKFELLDGFRSWYILQHYVKHGYKPFITELNFEFKESSE